MRDDQRCTFQNWRVGQELSGRSQIVVACDYAFHTCADASGRA